MALRRASPPEGVPPRSRSEESSDLRRACNAGAEPARKPLRNAMSRPYGNRRDHYAEQSTSKCEKHAVGKKLPSNSPA